MRLLFQVTEYVGSSGERYAGFRDDPTERLFERIRREADPAPQRSMMREFEKQVLDETNSRSVRLWCHRIVLYRSYVQDRQVSPGHYPEAANGSGLAREVENVNSWKELATAGGVYHPFFPPAGTGPCNPITMWPGSGFRKSWRLPYDVNHFP